VQSRDWVRAALAMPFDDEPGGNMLYSTGSTHLLSAILTRAGGRSTLELARDWLGPLEDFSIAAWERDPQGFYLGGNQMAMSPRSLLAFGELYRNGGKTPEGQQLVSREWVETSWRQRTNSRYTGDGYGYGWFLRAIGGRDVRYAWGYGGQMLYIVPDLGLTVVMTSEDNPSARNGHRDDLHALLAEIIGAVEAGEQAGRRGRGEGGVGGPTTSHRLIAGQKSTPSPVRFANHLSPCPGERNANRRSCDSSPLRSGGKVARRAEPVRGFRAYATACPPNLRR
jgi:hypothetical protein